MTFIIGTPDHPTYEEIVGSPVELLADSSRLAELPRLPLWARCTWCWSLNQVGYFYWPDDPISLDDGTTTTFTDWKVEAERANHLTGRPRLLHCSMCEAVTGHLAEKR